MPKFLPHKLAEIATVYLPIMSLLQQLKPGILPETQKDAVVSTKTLTLPQLLLRLHKMSDISIPQPFFAGNALCVKLASSVRMHDFLAGTATVVWAPPDVPSHSTAAAPTLGQNERYLNASTILRCESTLRKNGFIGA